MTGDSNFKLPDDFLEPIIEHGFEGMGQIMALLMNEAMKIERNRHIKANDYQRSNERDGYANGFKDKTIKTRLGEITLNIPQVRESSTPFYPKSLEKGSRSERALKLAIAQMYVQGVSTRKVESIAKELCGLEISSSEVSRISKLLDEELEKFRNRSLGKYPYVYFDAQYHKVRYSGTVIAIGIFTATGINEKGQREIIGISASLSEAEVHWRTFFEQLIGRGLCGIHLIISDDHAGLKAARNAIFPAIPWQRCQFHLAQNAQAYVPKKSMKEEIAIAVRDIFRCPTIHSAREQIRRTEQLYEKTAPEFVKWLSKNIEEGLTCLQFPVEHQKKIRTVNTVERLHKEVRRRTRVVGVFPNIESCLRLVTAVLVEYHETWSGSQALMNMKYLYNPEAVDLRDILRKVL